MLRNILEGGSKHPPWVPPCPCHIPTALDTMEVWLTLWDALRGGLTPTKRLLELDVEFGLAVSPTLLQPQGLQGGLWTWLLQKGYSCT